MNRLKNKKLLQVFMGVALFSVLWLVAALFSREFYFGATSDNVWDFYSALPSEAGVFITVAVPVILIAVSIISALYGMKSLFAASVIMVAVPVLSECLMSVLGSSEVLSFVFLLLIFIIYPFGMLGHYAIDAFSSCFLSDSIFLIPCDVFFRVLFVAGIILSTVLFGVIYRMQKKRIY